MGLSSWKGFKIIEIKTVKELTTTRGLPSKQTYNLFWLQWWGGGREEKRGPLLKNNQTRHDSIGRKKLQLRRPITPWDWDHHQSVHNIWKKKKKKEFSTTVDYRKLNYIFRWPISLFPFILFFVLQNTRKCEEPKIFFTKTNEHK